MLQQALHIQSCLLVAVVLSLGCADAIQNQRTVRSVTLLETQGSELDPEEALAGLATAAPRKFLWVVRERDAYDANLVARDLERVERFYQARGYYDVKVVAARVHVVTPREVELEIHVTPGPRVEVRSVKNDPRLLTLPGAVQLKVTAATQLPRGAPFEEENLDRTKQALTRVLKEAGFAYSKVNVRATVDLNARAADISIEIDPGRQARFGEIKIQGLKQIPESKVRAALGLKRGSRYSERDQEEAQAELSKLEVFSRVDISPDLSHPESDEVPLLVTVEEDKLRKLTFGGGSTLDVLRLSTHLRMGWEHKNFFGGARRFSVEAKPGVDFFPTRLDNLERFRGPTNFLFRNDALVRLEQPSIFNGRTRGFLRAEYDIYPLLYPLPENKDPRDEVVIGYHTVKAEAGIRRSFWGQRIELETSYNWQANFPFSYQNDIPVELTAVRVSFPRLSSTFQTKPGDLVKSKSKRDLGLSFRNSLELAGLKVGDTRLFGGSVSDIRLEPELRLQLPIFGEKTDPRQRAGDWTLAARFKLGFVLLPDYGESLRSRAANDPASQAEYQSATLTSDQQKLLFRAFYSGGPNSNRGYAYRAISPHGAVGFLIPTGLDCSTMKEDPGCIRPLGGFTQWESALELRFSALYPLTLAAFIDGSDVTRDIGVIQFQYPHLSAGPGVRYETAVGPLRLDFGVRLPGLQAIGQSTLPLDHGQERPSLFGLPAAIHLAIGDAF